MIPTFKVPWIYGEGVVDEAGLENVGIGLVEFRDGSGHLCK